MTTQGVMMSEFKKIALGLAALWPIAHMIVFMWFILSMFSAPQTADPTMFNALFVSHFLTILLILGQTVYYVIHIMKYNQKIGSDTNKIIWVLLLFFMNMLAIPVYWFMYIVKDSKA